MTKKLFYEDSYRTTFQAKVIDCYPYKDKFAVALEETLFYPEGGGQPSDRGTLQGEFVEHVFTKEEVILHVVPVAFAIGQVVEGVVDFTTRFDYMQQHTGEHILSGIVNDLYGYNNVGFHMAKTYVTADYDGVLEESEWQRVEDAVNQVIVENRPVVATIYPTSGEIKEDYRAKIEIAGEIRIVTVPGCDTCACCGTHVSYTGEVGLFKIINLEKYKGGTRVTLVCGTRALADYKNRLAATSAISRLLSAKQEDIIGAVEKQLQDIGSIKQTLVNRTNELFDLKAAHYTKTDKEVIVTLEKELDSEEMRRLCLKMMEHTTATCVVLVQVEGGLKYVIGNATKEVGSLCKVMNQQFNGKGGGKDICQGSLLTTYEILRQEGNSFLGNSILWYTIDK